MRVHVTDGTVGGVVERDARGGDRAVDVFFEERRARASRAGAERVDARRE